MMQNGQTRKGWKERERKEESRAKGRRDANERLSRDPVCRAVFRKKASQSQSKTEPVRAKIVDSGVVEGEENQKTDPSKMKDEMSRKDRRASLSLLTHKHQNTVKF